MRIALINENSQAAKNAMIEASLRKVVEPMGHEVINYGMYSADDACQITYVKAGLLACILLESGAADAIAMDIGVAKYQIQGKESEYTILDEPIQSEQYAIGFYLGNTELRDKVQAELDKMAADGTFAKISENWFGYDVCILGE